MFFVFEIRVTTVIDALFCFTTLITTYLRYHSHDCLNRTEFISMLYLMEDVVHSKSGKIFFSCQDLAALSKRQQISTEIQSFLPPLPVIN